MVLGRLPEDIACCRSAAGDGFISQVSALTMCYGSYQKKALYIKPWAIVRNFIQYSFEAKLNEKTSEGAWLVPEPFH